MRGGTDSGLKSGLNGDTILAIIIIKRPDAYRRWRGASKHPCHRPKPQARRKEAVDRKKVEFVDQKDEYHNKYETRDGYILLATGFTAKKTMNYKLRYIEAYNSWLIQIPNKDGSL